MLAITCAFAGSATGQEKRGLGGDNNALITGINAGWYYNWGSNANPDIAHAEYVPMFWAGFAVNANNIQKIIDNATSDYLLGFNEPERDDQADMSVQAALSKWADLQILRDHGFKLVSPAPSDTRDGRAWLDEFMDAVDDDPNLEVDEVAFHWYGSVNPNNPAASARSFLNKVDQYHNNYGRPVWITEFAGIDWAGNFDTATMQEANRIFLQTAVAGLESRSYVTRYAWWNHNNDSRLLNSGTNLPTVTGEGWIDTIFDEGEQFNFNSQSQGSDVFYLRGGEITNTGNFIEQALRYLDATEGDSTISGTADFGFFDSDLGFFKVRNGATLRKQGVNTVTVPGSEVTNDGTLLIQNGTLQLEDGTRLTGEGTLRIDQNGVLAISAGTEDDAVALSVPQIILNLGMLHVMDGEAVASKELRLWNPSEVRTDGDLVVSGFTSGAGSILSTGTGTLFLTSEGLHTNGATVSEGSLIVANTEASATGTGNVVVAGAGTFGGFGLVDGNVVVGAGGTVAPAVSQGTIISTPEIDEGVVVKAIEFDFAGIQDDAPLTQTSTLNQALRLVSGLDFGSSVRPRNGANDGNEFNVAGFRTDDNTGAASNSGDYLTFTIAPVEGLAIFVEDVCVELRRNGTAAATQYTILSSIDGFAWPDRWGTAVYTDTETHELNATNPGTEAVADEIEFRIVGTGADNDTGNTHFRAVLVEASFVSDPNSVAFDPTGFLELGGNYTQLDFTTLKIDLGGSVAGEFDQLQVAGNAVLNGTLDVSMLDGFTATAGQTFDIITANSVTGTFDNVIAPEGMDVQVTYSSNAVSLQVTAGLTGDFDADGDVDVEDIDFYAGNMNSPVTGDLAQLDFNGDGQITRQDLVLHIENFVQTSNGQTGALLGDLNLDGSVDILSDAFTVIGNLNQAVSSYADGDMDMNGTVNVLGDAFVLIGNLGGNNSAN